MTKINEKLVFTVNFDSLDTKSGFFSFNIGVDEIN